MTFADIQNHVYLLTKTNSTSLPAASLNLLVNKALNHVVSLIFEADGRWQWDDNNRADFPFATINIVSGQADYGLAVSHLRIEKVEVKDTNGGWTTLKPYNPSDFRSPALSQEQTLSGVPTAYDLNGQSVILIPKPNYSQADSIKVYFSRGPLEFDYTDNKFTDDTGSASSSPGFASPFHPLISLWAGYDYAIANARANANGIFADIQRVEMLLTKFYGHRNKDDRPQGSVKPISFR